MYGLECAETCGNCIGACDTQTGVCVMGCKAGWIGSKCIDGEFFVLTYRIAQ